jgi:hypothetical protein
MGIIFRPDPRDGDVEIGRAARQSNASPRSNRAHRVLAQFQRITPDTRSRSWAIALARTDGGLSFYGAGVTFFVFDDFSTLLLEGDKLYLGDILSKNFFEHPHAERAFL